MGRTKAIRYNVINTRKNVLKLNYNSQNLEEVENFLKNGAYLTEGEKMELILELGCGKGEHIVKLAENNPGCMCVGVDLKGDRIYIGSTYALENNLDNCVFVRARVEDFLINLKSVKKSFKVKEIWITFPDPQPNKQEKSLVSEIYQRLIQGILSENSKIILKTDSELVLENFKKNYLINGFKELENEHLDVKSAFEQKFNKLGVETKIVTVKKV